MKIKAIFCFLALLIFIGVTTKAITTLQIRGSVSELTNGNAVSGLNVIIESTLNNGDYYRNFALTDSDGIYDNTLDLTEDFTSGRSLITVTDCFGNSVDTTVFYSSLSSVHECNFEICYLVPTTCTADFTYVIDEDSPLTVHFEDKSTGSAPFFYHWTFDGLSHSLEENPTHTFPSPGVYQVCLDIYAQFGGCSDQKCIPVIVTNSDCKALFNTTIDGLTVSAEGETEYGDEDDVLYFWSFDGIFYTGKNVTHIFDQAGRYNVSLTTENNDGCIGYYETKVSVGNFHTIDAVFSYETDPNDPYLFLFTNSSQKEDLSYVWTFGDGGTSFAENPQHHFDDGTFLVNLLIYEQGDIISSYASFVSAPGYSCNSNFTVTRDYLNLHFVGESDSPYETIFTWDIAGIDSLEGEEVDFTFPDYGLYEITLHTEDSDGCQYTIIKNIDVYNYQPSIDYTFDGFSYTFTGYTNSDYITDYLWKIDETTCSTEKEFTHIFPENGNYNVELITVDSQGSIDSISEQITVDYQGSCQPSYQWITDTIDNKIFYEFSNTSSGIYDSIEWSFGDGATSNEDNPQYVFENSQKYDVCLSLWNRDPQYYTHATYCVEIDVNNGDYFDFGGQIYGGYFPVSQSEVMLYLKNGNSVEYVTTSMVNDDGIYYFYQVLAGDYLLRSRPLSSTDVDEDFVNTYVGEEIFWKDAAPTTLNADNWENDIILQKNPKLVLIGNSLIEGTVESNSNDEFLPGIDILLFDNSFNLLDATRTDENGQFSFSDIAYGEYIVYPEVTGKITYPYYATLNEQTPDITDIRFGVDDNYVVLGVEDADDIQLSISPNPATNLIFIDCAQFSGSKAQIVISDLSGRVVMSFGKKYLDSKERFDISNLASGTYIVEIRTAVGSFNQKFLKR